ncbi:hypothetical protein MTO96_038688 [Rhipicephalus appendiculatus]
MLLGRTHGDDDDPLHDVLEFERIERERRELFGLRNRSLTSPSFSERSLPATMTKKRPSTRTVERIDASHCRPSTNTVSASVTTATSTAT